MRIFITVLFLIFSFQSWTKAEDIRDFEIEGISIGDSLLDFFSEDKLKNNLGTPYPNSDKFITIEFAISSEIYDAMSFNVKKNDEKYIIYAIAGFKDYEINMEDCFKFKDEVSKEVEKIFVNIEKEPYKKKHSGDKTGKSINEGYDFNFKSGDKINIACYDWSKTVENEMNFLDHLRVGLITYEFRNWLNQEAF